MPELYDRSPPAENKPLISDESTEILPAAISIPWPPAKCALVSDALGPVYVKIPVAESYEKLPSPPASIPIKALLAAESALAVV